MNVVRKAHAFVGAKKGSRMMRLYSAEDRTMFSPPPSKPPEAELENETRSAPVSWAQPIPIERLEICGRTSRGGKPESPVGEPSGYSEVARERTKLTPNKSELVRGKVHGMVIPWVREVKNGPLALVAKRGRTTLLKTENASDARVPKIPSLAKPSAICRLSGPPSSCAEISSSRRSRSKTV